MRANSQRKSVAESASKSKDGRKVGGGIGGAESTPEMGGVDDDMPLAFADALSLPLVRRS